MENIKQVLKRGVDLNEYFAGLETNENYQKLLKKVKNETLAVVADIFNKEYYYKATMRYMKYQEKFDAKPLKHRIKSLCESVINLNINEREKVKKERFIDDLGHEPGHTDNYETRQVKEESIKEFILNLKSRVKPDLYRRMVPIFNKVRKNNIKDVEEFINTLKEDERYCITGILLKDGNHNMNLGIDRVARKFEEMFFRSAVTDYMRAKTQERKQDNDSILPGFEGDIDNLKVDRNLLNYKVNTAGVKYIENYLESQKEKGKEVSLYNIPDVTKDTIREFLSVCKISHDDIKKNLIDQLIDKSTESEVIIRMENIKNTSMFRQDEDINANIEKIAEKHEEKFFRAVLTDYLKAKEKVVKNGTEDDFLPGFDKALNNLRIERSLFYYKVNAAGVKYIENYIEMKCKNENGKDMPISSIPAIPRETIKEFFHACGIPHGEIKKNLLNQLTEQIKMKEVIKKTEKEKKENEQVNLYQPKLSI
ncbi:MAG: hypothetical protein HPY53_01360 [Brevinematales bacterium]|nr:hypothetical protein [Brevinematales bacterium]